MKQCPNCRGLELYDDAEMQCPHCHTVLVPYERARRRQTTDNYDRRQEESIRPRRREDANRIETPQFEQHAGGRITYRGVVVSVTPTSRFMSRGVKWANAVFMGQPYQLGNPVHETFVRIEEISPTRLPDRLRNLVYYGELGELDIGDDVTVTAVRRNNRLIIKRLTINDVESEATSHGQISAAAVRALSLVAAVLVVFLVAAILSFFISGGIWTLLGALVGGTLSLAGKLLTVLAPILGLLFVYWLFFRKR